MYSFLFAATNLENGLPGIGIVTVKDSGQCQNSCDVTYECVAWTFRKEDRACILMDQQEHCNGNNRFVLNPLDSVSGLSVTCEKQFGSFRSFLRCRCAKGNGGHAVYSGSTVML